jgi:hypothetical protein
MGGIGGVMGQGGIGALQGPMQMFGQLAQGIMGQLGNMGLSGMQTPPMQGGRVGMPYTQPGMGMQGPPRPGGNLGGPGLSPTENKLMGTFSGLEQQQNALMDKLNDPNLSQADIAKIQQQLQKIKQMMEMITKAMGEMNKIVSNIIQNIRS